MYCALWMRQVISLVIPSPCPSATEVLPFVLASLISKIVKFILIGAQVKFWEDQLSTNLMGSAFNIYPESSTLYHIYHKQSPLTHNHVPPGQLLQSPSRSYYTLPSSPIVSSSTRSQRNNFLKSQGTLRYCSTQNSLMASLPD